MAARKKTTAKAAPAEKNELLEALELIEKEKGITKDFMIETISNSIATACKDEFKNGENIKINFDEITGTFKVFEEKTVVDVVENEALEISKEEARFRFGNPYEVGDIVSIEATPKDFGRKAAKKAKDVIIQKIHEEERRALFKTYQMKENDIVTGEIQCFQDPDRGNYNIIVKLGKIETVLTVAEQIKGEEFYKNERVKLYVTRVEDGPRGFRVSVSRTHPDLVKRLFEQEVTEISDGIVEIKGISREAGQRTKISVYSHDPNVDPVGACVGVNGQRVNAIVDELHGEKIDIIVWDEDPAVLIANALSPAKVVSVTVDPAERKARVIVPDYQLSLAIGREGQNARLAAKLTEYKIDIKSESQDAEQTDEVAEDYSEEAYSEEEVSEEE